MAAAVSEHFKNWCVCSGMLFYGWLISNEQRDFHMFLEGACSSPVKVITLLLDF